MSEEKKVMNKNKLIAEYMGFKIVVGEQGIIKGMRQWRGQDVKNPLYDKIEANQENQLWFHVSWDWLMPVIKKIFKLMLNKNFESRYEFDILYGCTREITLALEKVDLKKAHRNTVRFIKEYNRLQNN